MGNGLPGLEVRFGGPGAVTHHVATAVIRPERAKGSVPDLVNSGNQNTPVGDSGLYQASFGPAGLGVAGQMLRPASSGESHFCILIV